MFHQNIKVWATLAVDKSVRLVLWFLLSQWDQSEFFHYSRREKTFVLQT